MASPAGRDIATLVNEEQSAGWKEVKWNARLRSANFGGQATNVASGMYLVRMHAHHASTSSADGRQTATTLSSGQAGNFSDTKRVLFMK